MSVYKILVEIQEAFEQQSFFLPPIMKQKISDMLAAHYEPVPDAEYPHTHKGLSEEQPWPKENQVMKPAPHRATIALIPHCPNGFCPFWMVEVDSEAVFIGTEAEAKAKLESLRGGNNGA